MKIAFSTSQIHGNVTRTMQTMADTKLAFLEGRVNPDEPVKVTIRKEGAKQVKVNIAVVLKDNHHIYISDRGSDFYSVFPSLTKRLSETVNQYTNKKTNRNTNRTEQTEEQVTETDIKRRKVIVADRMTEAEAVEQAEELGHAWFVFRNKDIEGEPECILYTRVSGDWGIASIR